MIDVVFLLIIFFLCLDFRTLEAKLPANLPKDRGTSSKREQPKPGLDVRIVVDAEGEKVPRDHAAGFRRVGHRVHWRVGPRVLHSLEEVRACLEGHRADPTFRAPDEHGVLRPGAVTVLPGDGATYGDVAQIVDVIHAAGLDRIHFGG